MATEHHRQGWAKHSKKARARIQAMLPLPCQHCGRVVTLEDKWDVAHVVDLAHGGNIHNYGAAHSRCNRSDGGRQGALKTNSRRKNLRAW